MYCTCMNTHAVETNLIHVPETDLYPFLQSHHLPHHLQLIQDALEQLLEERQDVTSTPTMTTTIGKEKRHTVHVYCSVHTCTCTCTHCRYSDKFFEKTS